MYFYIAPIQKLNSALSALHILLPWQTCSFFKTSQPSLQPRTHTHEHTHTLIQREGGNFLNFPGSIQCNAAILQALSINTQHSYLSLSIARYPFYTWVGWENSGKIPFPRVNEVTGSSLEPRTFHAAARRFIHSTTSPICFFSFLTL